MSSVKELFCGLTTNPLPSPRKRTSDIAHAPFRNCDLTTQERKNALFNALRYFPPSTHAELAPEFAKELVDYGHIYMYRFLPNVPIKAYPISDLPCKHQHGSAIAHMILNNLDPKVAQFPEELVTYGGNGQVFSNWAQFWIVMYYLSIMNDDQTLVMYSGHPLGLFESNSSSPRVVVTNGMVIPNYSSKSDYDKMFAQGVTLYGQMTAGSYCYIGPQGIVHGTVLTVLNAGRKYLGLESLKGKVFLTSGLGGMSGAQAKAAVICDCVGITAEVSYEALYKRYEQGWVTEIIDADLDKLVARVRQARKNKETTAIGYHGNVVDIWEKFVNIYEETGEMLVDLGSDQTSCHNPFNGGYYPVQLGFEESQLVLKQEPKKFASLVQESLRRQIKAINTLADAGNLITCLFFHVFH
uniref:Urocanate hydratase 1 [Xenopus (Silurana) tropicalis] n=1 Tax=Lepeophtheirus salmonis TaxID=72036 RepID=A0A0K2TLA4_LEPSM